MIIYNMPENVPKSAIFAFYTLGVAIMLPWNFFITADSYWQYKLRNVSLGENWNLTGMPSTYYQVSVIPAFNIISHLIIFIFTFVASGTMRRIGEKERIYGSLLLCLLTLATFTTLSIANTDGAQTVFYGMTMAMVAMLNVGIAILQASLFGLVGIFPSRCVTSLISGMSLAGVISSLAQIISLAIGSADPVITGIIYFVLADGFIILSIGMYMKLTHSNLYKGAKSNGTLNTKKKATSFAEYFQIFKKIGRMGFTLGFVLLVTLSIFPVVQVYVSSSHAGIAWGDVYFQPTITFLIFAVMDMVGREAAERIRWPSHDGTLLHILGVCRIVFVPLILLCYGNNKTFSTLFFGDAYYIVLNFLFSFTHGYIIGLTMIYYPRFVSDEEMDIAGALMASILGVGMILGAALSPVFVIIWGPITK